MFYYISGELVLIDPQTAVIDAGGVGYKLTISGTTCGKLAGKLGEKVRLFTYMAVREDAVDLYGFNSTEELAAFRLLISVSGIGSKSAVSILTLMTPEKLAIAVAAGDSKAISKAQGIGAKTAARIVLELKDKIAKEIAPAGPDDAPSDVSQAADGDSFTEAVNALVVLGYSRPEANYALKGAPAGADTEALIRYALSKSNVLRD